MQNLYELMTNNTEEFRITLDGNDYLVFAGIHNFEIYDITDGNNRVISELYGECNPLVGLWCSLEYKTADADEKQILEEKCICEAIQFEIEQHLDFCLQQITQGCAK